jgi:hypothetical protein
MANAKAQAIGIYLVDLEQIDIIDRIVESILYHERVMNHEEDVIDHLFGNIRACRRRSGRPGNPAIGSKRN